MIFLHEEITDFVHTTPIFNPSSLATAQAMYVFPVPVSLPSIAALFLINAEHNRSTDGICHSLNPFEFFILYGGSVDSVTMDFSSNPFSGLSLPKDSLRSPFLICHSLKVHLSILSFPME